jgi:uncharacterized membrane protein
MISTISNLPLVGQLHFLVGVIGLLAGVTPFLVRKGGTSHRLAGQVFVVCMLLLCASGLYMSLARSILFTAFLALLAGHAVTTGWMAAARITGRAERVAAGVISLVAMAAAGSGLVVASLPSGTLNDLPPVAFYSLGGVAFWIAGIDILALRRGAANDRQRLTRHIWRMGFALFIASFIFFFGNNSVLPPVLRSPLALLTPVLTVIGLTLYAGLRMRLGRRPAFPSGMKTQGRGEGGG